MTPAEFIGHLFLARDVAHSVHLNTRSYAKHMALAAFYDGIIDLADTFAEAYQGRHGLVGSIPLLSTKKAGNIIEFLQASLEEIEKKRSFAGDDSSLQNIIDEVVALYLQTLYKLRYLA